MACDEPARTTFRPLRARRIRLAGLLAVIAALAAALGFHSGASSPRTGSASPRDSSPSVPAPPVDRHPADRGGALGEADGFVPDGTTVFDDEVPGVANLDADLLRALRQAATGAADDGVAFVVDSGWRSPEYQEQLLRDAIAKYGSRAEAARWVATPGTSAHVKGEAVDIASRGAEWLSEHGARFGLCQIYANEPWHYELRPEAVVDGCAAMYPDPTHDPRLQR